MREILFKAKQTNNAQWVEGYFFKDGEQQAERGDAQCLKQPAKAQILMMSLVNMTIGCSAGIQSASLR